MTKAKSSINNTIWVAIDVAKHKHDVLIEYPNGTRKSLVIKQSQEEFDRLKTYLEREDYDVTIGFEATGYYHRLLAYYLLKQNFTVK